MAILRWKQGMLCDKCIDTQTTGDKLFMLFKNSKCYQKLVDLYFIYEYHKIVFSSKVALQILGRKFYKNTKKSCLGLYCQNFLIFIHKTHLVENHRKPSDNSRN